jgi:hypothetical protein
MAALFEVESLRIEETCNRIISVGISCGIHKRKNFSNGEIIQKHKLSVPTAFLSCADPRVSWPAIVLKTAMTFGPFIATNITFSPPNTRQIGHSVPRGVVMGCSMSSKAAV